MLLLANAQLIDGSGAPARSGAVLIEDERIAAVGQFPTPPGAEILDCRDLTVAPGFIDLHSHSDLQVLEHRQEKRKQGVTTEAVGNCGFSPFPYGSDPAALRSFGAGILGQTDGWGWPSAAGYLRALETAGVRDNVLPLVGHGSLRIAVHGLDQTALSTGELDTLRGALADSLDAGCAGFTTGLMYAPGSAADHEELAALSRVVAGHGKLYASHIRGYGRTLLDAVDEQLRLAERTGCRLQISHLQAAGRANWHLQEAALAAIEEARERGVDVEFDIYPYQCGSTVLTQLLPLWALEGGVSALPGNLASPRFRDRLLGEWREQSAADWAGVTVSSVGSAGDSPLIGQTIAQIAAVREIDPASAAIDLLREEAGAVNIVTFNQSEPNLRQLLQHPLCSVITDGFYVKGKPHPRLHGTYPELLGRIVRERGWLSLSEAIRKSTAQPAARLGLHDRGRLAPGARADLVIFDAARIASSATYEDPARDPKGIAAVIQAGKLIEQKNLN